MLRWLHAAPVLSAYAARVNLTQGWAPDIVGRNGCIPALVEVHKITSFAN